MVKQCNLVDSLAGSEVYEEYQSKIVCLLQMPLISPNCFYWRSGCVTERQMSRKAVYFGGRN
jgi:hypothetical protein